MCDTTADIPATCNESRVAPQTHEPFTFSGVELLFGGDHVKLQLHGLNGHFLLSHQKIAFLTASPLPSRQG